MERRILVVKSSTSSSLPSGFVEDVQKQLSSVLGLCGQGEEQE